MRKRQKFFFRNLHKSADKNRIRSAEFSAQLVKALGLHRKTEDQTVVIMSGVILGVDALRVFPDAFMSDFRFDRLCRKRRNGGEHSGADEHFCLHF